MAMLANDIYIGSVNTPLYHFTNANLELGSPKGIYAVDVIDNELSIDTFSVTIAYGNKKLLYKLTDNKLYRLVGNQLYALSQTAPKDYMKEVPTFTPVWWYVGGSFYAKGYLKSVDRVSKYGFKLTCVSGVGLLDSTMHTGGLYQGVAFSTVLSSIIGGAFTYTVANDVQSTLVYGRLPYDTRRNNLHRLLFATGATLKKGDANTDYSIEYLNNTVTDVPSSRVSLQGSVGYQLPSNKVEVTEHTYFPASDATTETLFDNHDGTTADHLTVVFDGPAYSLGTTGTLVINESGVNYAVVSGAGTLTGKYYTHVTQIITLVNNPNNDPERVRRVTDNELVTAANSHNVARRVLSFYQSAKTVKAKIMLNGEKCGQLLRFTDAFGDVTQGYLSRMDTLVTSVIGAQCQLIDGYKPDANGNNFINRAFISTNQSWTVPAGVHTIRIILIGGGQGGQGGYKGADGCDRNDMAQGFYPEENCTVYAYENGEQRTPAGGAAGAGGQQGKIAIYDKDVSPGAVISLTVGIGGDGGAQNGGAGAAGSASTASGGGVGNLSSDNGTVMNGWYDPFTGDVYAVAGSAGIAGGNGGLSDVQSTFGNNGANGRAGDSVGAFSGGAGGAGYIGEKSFAIYGVTYYTKCSGGGGGGAAYGANGSPGTAGWYWDHVVDDVRHYDNGTGNGGNGANASPPNAATYSNGGNGGNGGGGGGNAGGAMFYQGTYVIGDNSIGSKGIGGAGSVGGTGGNGCIIILY